MLKQTLKYISNTHKRNHQHNQNNHQKENYFSDNNKCYSQTNSRPVVSSLSGLTAKIFISHLEQKYILHSNEIQICRHPHILVSVCGCNTISIQRK